MLHIIQNIEQIKILYTGVVKITADITIGYEWNEVEWQAYTVGV